jgi:zinc-ribbon domain
MKSTLGWILAIVFGVILLILLPGLWMMGRFWQGGYGGMMGGSGMMGGYGFMHPFGWGGMLLAWLIPVGVIALLVMGAVVLINSLNRSGNPTLPPVVRSRTCPNCGKPAQTDLNTCPYCGQKLS